MPWTGFKTERTNQFQLALYWLHSFPEQSVAASVSPPTAHVVQNHNNAEKKHNSSKVGDGENLLASGTAGMSLQQERYSLDVFQKASSWMLFPDASAVELLVVV